MVNSGVCGHNESTFPTVSHQATSASSAETWHSNTTGSSSMLLLCNSSSGTGQNSTGGPEIIGG